MLALPPRAVASGSPPVQAVAAMRSCSRAGAGRGADRRQSGKEKEVARGRRRAAWSAHFLRGKLEKLGFIAYHYTFDTVPYHLAVELSLVGAQVDVDSVSNLGLLASGPNSPEIQEAA